MRFKDQVVIVTGASSGIGRASALRFAQEGAKVVVAARRFDRLDELVRQIQAQGGYALAMPTDVTNKSQVEALITRTVKEYGRVDVMLNNAGKGFGGAIGEMDIGGFEETWRTNVLGVVHCIQAVLPVMKSQKSGLIANVSSVIGMRSLPYQGGYCATKFAVVGISEALRAELIGSGIDVVLILPYVTATEFFKSSLVEELVDKPPAERPAWMRNMQSAEDAAKNLVDAVAGRKHVAILARQGKMMVFMQRHAPWFLDWVMARGAEQPK